MEITQQGIDEVLTLLAATPRRIEAATARVAPAQLVSKTDAKSWSVNEILAHLRGCVDVWGETIDRMLAEERPTLRYLSPRTYLHQTDYTDLPFADSLAIFVVERTALLAKLRPLSLDGWARSAMIKDKEHTIFSQARRMAMHEEGHCVQIEQQLAVASEQPK